jgi:ATP-binding cassette subfamily B protein
MAADPPANAPEELDGSASDRLANSLRQLFCQLSAARRKQFYVVLVLMLVGAVGELATIGAILPFLTLLTNSSGAAAYPLVLDAFGAHMAQERVIAAAAGFSLIVMVAGLVRFQLVRSLQRFSYGLAHDLYLDIERRFLFQPYRFHVEHNTSSLISALDKSEILVFDVIIPLMEAAIASFIALAIVAALVAVDPAIALIAAAVLAIVNGLVSLVTTRHLSRNSTAISTGFDRRLKVVQESLGGIRDVILDRSQDAHLAMLDRVNSSLATARADTAIIASAPRFIVETAGIVVVAVLAVVASRHAGGLAGAIPVLGAVALGAQRLLPLVQQVYHGGSTAFGYLSVVSQTADVLNLPAGDTADAPKHLAPLSFRKSIRLDNVSFAHGGGSRFRLQDISLEIHHGSSVAIVGETGSGKSTLADIIMGLIEPTEGELSVDGVPVTPANARLWQSTLAHVPQAIFLADATIARNIALGSGEMDRARVAEAAELARIADFVATLPDGYDTVVGERGVRLSGGQRQRIGIARALYRRPSLLILDEATSSLDEATEKAVIESLDRLAAGGTTLVLISHRPSAIAGCDIVVGLQHGRIVGKQSR